MPSSLRAGAIEHLQFSIDATNLAAKTTQYFYAPVDGVIAALELVTQEAIVTGGVAKLQASTGLASALADVPGATITVPNAQIVGTRQIGIATLGVLGRQVAKGDLVAINLASFTGGGAVRGQIAFYSTQDPSPQAGFKTPSGG